MKINKQTTRKIGKGLNLFVALLMILQPVGTPGLLGAIAFADDSTVQSADVQAPAPETKADSTPAEDASSTVDSSATTDAGNKASDAKSESAVNPTIETPKDAGIVPAETPATTTTETPAATGESSDPAVVQSASDAVQTNSASTQADSDTSNSSTDNSNPTISPDAAGTTIAPKDTFSTAKQEERGNLETVVVNNVKAKSLDLKKIDPENVEQTAKLATDKADYAPTGTAIITGTGFIAGETYTLIISSNDEPPVSKTVQVTADKTGQFVYAYQLDGNYRPDYKVESKDSTGDVIASVTFTDSVIPSNKVGISMTGFVLSGAYSLPGGQPTGKGQLKNGNVGAYPEGACIPVEMKIENNDNSTGDTIVSPVFDYFDTVVGIDHLEKITTNITGDPSSSADNLNDFSYPGSDLKAVTSFSNSTGGNTAATISGPYAGGTAGTSSVTATNAQRHYNITLSSIAPGVTVYLTFCGRLDLDASQYNGGSAMSIRSAQGGNENVPIPVNQILQLPSLTLAKIVQGGSATPDQWSFDTTTSINGQSHFSIPSGQNLVTIPNVSPDGDFSITESGPDGYSFSSGTGANCTFNGSIATATVAAGNPPKNASCTFTNIVQESHLTLVKTVTNNNGGSAATTDWTLSASGPTSISGATGSGAVTNAIVSAGAYTLSESGGPSGYTASNYSCVKNNDSAVDGNSITLAPGDNATCTITNDDQPGTLIVKKVVVNNNGGTKQAQDFSFSVDGGASQAFESDGQNDLTVDADTYDVTEPAVDGYTTTYNNCTNVVVPNGGTATCTITNNDQAATLTVIKHVVNDNGGTKTAGAFTMNVTGSNVSDSSFAGAEDPGTTVTLNAGAYSVDEDAVFGYAKTIGADCSGTIANGDHKTCTITNDDIQPKLIVIKHVVADNGGGAVASDFTMSVTGSSPTPASFSGAESPGTDVAINAGSYSVGESGSSGYNGTPSPDCTGEISVGETKTCTITNDDQPAHIIVIKHVVNDDGGLLSSGNFTMHISGTAGSATFAGVESPGVNTQVNAGTFDVSEDAISGYSSSTSGDCSGSIAVGETKTCTITNNDQPATLIVKKIVNNYFGGTKLSDDFSFSVNGGSATSFEADGENDLTVDAGTYNATEPKVDGYSTTYDNCSGLVIPNGGSATCTITNSDIQPKLTVTKVVINNNGGTKVVSDFPLFVGATSVTSGAQNGFNVGDYVVGETGSPGYAETISGDCVSDGSVSLALGEEKACTITNNDIAPKLTLVKTVVNDNGGTRKVADFPLFINGNSVSSGDSNTLSANTLYTASETPDPGYSASVWGQDCAADGTITLLPGNDKTCTITNDDKSANLVVTKHVINDNGGNANAADFTMNVTGANVAPSASFQGDESGTSVTLDAGSYGVDENDFAGYAKTIGTDCSGTIANGETKYCTITNDDISGTLEIVKNTIGGDGQFDFAVTGSTPSAPSVTTLNGTGFAGPANVDAGSYSVKETVPAGWDLTSAACDDGSSTFSAGTVTDIQVALAQNVTCTFTNTKRGRIVVNKVTDPDQNSQSFGFATTGTDFNGFSLTGVTGANSNEQELVPGAYSVSENPALGWELSGAVCQSDFQNSEEIIANTAIDPANINLHAGETVSCTFNNHFTPPFLLIEKSNNNPAPDITLKPGDSVMYTLKVTAQNNDVNGVTVTDLPPAGFAFEPGTETANSSLGGAHVGPLVLAHAYASPGVWNLGDMKKDEVITLTYQTTISPNQASGTYPDLAYAAGKSLINDEILGEGTNSQFVDGAFVGTKVAVAKQGIVELASVKIHTDTHTHHKHKHTKHKTRVLPATGGSPLWPIAAGVLLATGAVMIFLGRKKGKDGKKSETAMKIFLAIFLAGAIFAGSQKAFAASDFAAQMEDPKSPVATNSFQLGFVALDFSGDPLEIQCFINDSATPFQTIDLAAGGTSGNCTVDGSVVPTPGTYQFHIVAVDGVETATSQTVSVEYIATGPGTPTNYDRSKTSDCDYQISFVSANDGGRTVKVELYRSTERTFVADATTKIDELTIGSGQAGSFTTTKPVCGDTYYYAIRAFDALGNGSGVVADERTIVRTTGGGTRTVTTTVVGGGGAIPVGGGAVASAATGGETGGTVEGAQTPSEEEQTPASEEGKVLGEEQARGGSAGETIKKHPYFYSLLGLIILYALYYIAAKKRKKGGLKPPIDTPPADPFA